MSSTRTRRTLAEIPVSEAMHPGTLTCPPETPLRTVARMMATYRVHCVFVLADAEEADSERVLWRVVSDRDLARAASDDLDERSAGGTAATPLVSVSPGETLKRAAQLIAESETSHLVVVDPVSARPIGVLSTLDIACAIAEA